jgi:hypothetical protein
VFLSLLILLASGALPFRKLKKKKGKKRKNAYLGYAFFHGPSNEQRATSNEQRATESLISYTIRSQP